MTPIVMFEIEPDPKGMISMNLLAFNKALQFLKDNNLNPFDHVVRPRGFEIHYVWGKSTIGHREIKMVEKAVYEICRKDVKPGLPKET